MLIRPPLAAAFPATKAIAYPYAKLLRERPSSREPGIILGCGRSRSRISDYRFDKRVYGKEEIQAQIKAVFDAGSAGFMVGITG
jgi:hypothetical protein